MTLRVGDASKRHCTPVAVRLPAPVSVASPLGNNAASRSLRREASGAYCTTDAAVGPSVCHETRISSGASPSDRRTCEGAAVSDEPHSAAAAHASASASSRRGPMAGCRRS